MQSYLFVELVCKCKRADRPPPTTPKKTIARYSAATFQYTGRAKQRPAQIQRPSHAALKYYSNPLQHFLESVDCSSNITIPKTVGRRARDSAAAPTSNVRCVARLQRVLLLIMKMQSRATTVISSCREKTLIAAQRMRDSAFVSIRVKMQRVR